MKSLTLCILPLSLLLVACGNENAPAPAPGEKLVTGEDVKKEVGEAVDTAKDFTMQKRDEYAKQINQKLKGLDVKIAELEAKGANLKDDAKKKWNEKLDDLKMKRGKVAEKVDQFSKSSADAWEGLKKDMDSAWENLKKSYDNTAEAVKD